MGFPKLSMLAFYWSFFDLRARPIMRKMLYAITAFVIVCYLTILFDDTFFCGKNVAVQWSQEEGACSVFYAPEPFILNFTLNLACYLAVYAVPLVLLAQGVLRAETGVMMTFGLGALTIAASVVRFVTLKVGTGQANLVCKLCWWGRNGYVEMILTDMCTDPLSMVEMTLSIIVVALPGLKPLLQRRAKI
jgi:hypothetical protein